MNIKEAIERVRDIDRKLDHIQRYSAAGQVRSGDIRLTYGSSTIDLSSVCPAEERERLLDLEIDRLKTEREKLAAVIDMANAALKGIGA